MANLLPAATYQSPPRQARGRQLNTIREDKEETNFGSTSGSGTDTDEGTVIGRPAGLDAKYFIAAPKKNQVTNLASAFSPSTDESSPSSGYDAERHPVEFDDLYDVSDQETEFSDSCPSLRDSVSSAPTSFAPTDSNRNSGGSASSSRNRYPSITIPKTSAWHSMVSPMKASPVPPTPPPKIQVSPAVLSRIARWVPAVNAPPSLGSASSVTSDQRTNLSAPVTPEMHNIIEGQSWGGHNHVRLRDEPDSAHSDPHTDDMSDQEEVLIDSSDDHWSEIMGHFPRIPGATPQENSPLPPNFDSLPLASHETPSEASTTGVRLPTEALRTLNHLVPDRSPDLVSDASIQEQREREMRERSDPPSRPRSLDGVTPLSDYSGYSFSKLSIPSPGGFFSSLLPGTRHTWCPGQPGNASNPPSSTTAENFYNVPWQGPERIVERVVELDDNMTDDQPTARQATFILNEPARKFSMPEHVFDRQESPVSSTGTMQNISRTGEIRYEYEEAYENELAQTAAANKDRTSVWLAAQSTYMSALRETNPLNDMNKDWTQERRLSAQGKNDSLDSPMKKAVRFLEEAIITSPQPATHIGEQKEAIFHQAFRHMSRERKRRDAFVHATARIDAVQTLRVALKDMHIDQLLGKYEIREPERPKYSGPFSQNPRQTGVFDLTPAQMAFKKVEREKEALDQISSTAWVVDALKYLNGNRILASPASRRLDKATLPLNDPKCVGSKRVRVLDLGGNTSCDWAWHCAAKWPNVKVYTVVTKTQTSTPTFKGPSNHRQVSVPHVWQLPFRDGHFDVISARSLHAMLKHEPVPGQTQIDEYDLCLKECMRVLKPGGYLEYMLMDASVAHAGPLGSAMSVEFGFNLKTRGYDALATKVFLRRLRKANFVGLKRAWMFLPMGAPMRESAVVRETPTPHVPSMVDADVEAVLGPVGGTADVANISGLLGGWMWEQWMLKLQMEMGRDKGKLLEGVSAVIEEGRNCGSGWRCLSGWAQKPRRQKGTIRIKIDG